MKNQNIKVISRGLMHSYGHASVVQLLLAASPIMVLLCYFLYRASKRPSERCYDYDLVSQDEVNEVCKLIPLRDMVIWFLAVAFMFSLLAVYLSLFVEKRRALVEEYLRSGKRILGNVHYKKSSIACCRMANYGTAVYPHPHYDKMPVYIRRKVRVVERYTREGCILLYLQNKTFSAQPLEELEIDQRIYKENHSQLRITRFVVWALVVFCYLAPIYILKIINDMNGQQLFKYQPEYNSLTAIKIYIFVAGIAIPLIAMILNWVLWKRHEHWMTVEHKILEEGDDEELENGSWYDPEDQVKQPYRPQMS